MMLVLQAIVETLGWTFFGVILLYGAVSLFDMITPTDYRGEIRRGNVAAAIFVGAFIVALTAIIVAVIVT
ncbi:MAG: DUF350 domain-containing protein [Cyanobacteria bacterium]|jgi:uncharacterized membrane protein YjfL (UPF0719 family)|nr:DUF350 domain-containing protein [Cyanobacteria bacterium GSL.Bin1]